MTTLADLADRLTAVVPAVAALSATQRESAVRAALADLGRRVRLRKTATLATAPGQASYVLPAGCLQVIRLASIDEAGASDGQPTPFLIGARESWSVAGRTLTITPTPQVASARTLVYAATYVADAGGAYADLTDDAAEAALLFAEARAYELLAAAAPTEAGAGVKKYTQGEVTIERATGDDRAKTYAQAAARASAAYEQAVAAMRGPSGMRG